MSTNNIGFYGDIIKRANNIGFYGDITMRTNNIGFNGEKCKIIDLN